MRQWPDTFTRRPPMRCSRRSRNASPRRPVARRRLHRDPKHSSSRTQATPIRAPSRPAPTPPCARCAAAFAASSSSARVTVWRFAGSRLSAADAFLTPLGAIDVARDAADVLRTLRRVRELDRAHALEHSLEVQLPFLQTVLADFDIVPLLVGDATPEEVGGVLEALWGGPGDTVRHQLGPQPLPGLRHRATHRPRHHAGDRDRSTWRHRRASTPAAAGPICGLLWVARAHGLHATTLDVPAPATPRAITHASSATARTPLRRAKRRRRRGFPQDVNQIGLCAAPAQSSCNAPAHGPGRQQPDRRATSRRQCRPQA